VNEESSKSFLADETRKAVLAEEAVRDKFQGHQTIADELMPFSQPEVRPLVLSTLSAVEYGGEPPVVRHEVPPDGLLAGHCAGPGSPILLNPTALTRWVVLHELAHWLDPEAPGHGETFRSIFVHLLRAAFGKDQFGDSAADALTQQYEMDGVPITSDYVMPWMTDERSEPKDPL
jgi:hypothetical protein